MKPAQTLGGGFFFAARASRLCGPGLGTWLVRLATRLLSLATWLVIVVWAGGLMAAPPLTYRQARDFLAGYTKVLELANEDGARVAVCPEFQGRVMTSTCSGFEGESLGWINRRFIEEKVPDKHFNNFGGEDRFWLAPEGGQYSLWFAPGASQDLAHWFTPPALNSTPFQFNLDKPEPRYLLKANIQLHNAARTEFKLDVEREIRILGASHFARLFGAEAADLMTSKNLKLVGFESRNMIVNRGLPMTSDRGLVSIWSAGMFPATPTTEVLVPFKAGDESKLGPPITDDYFGKVPSDRLKVGENLAVFRADGQLRSKIGTPQLRAVPVAGAIDRSRGLLTLVQFEMPRDPESYAYLDNHWQNPLPDPYRGDVFSSYSDGPTDMGAPSGGFFELESVSPAIRLPTGKSLKHTHRTFHIEGDVPTLERIAEAALQVKLTPSEVADKRAGEE